MGIFRKEIDKITAAREKQAANKELEEFEKMNANESRDLREKDFNKWLDLAGKSVQSQ